MAGVGRTGFVLEGTVAGLSQNSPFFVEFRFAVVILERLCPTPVGMSSVRQGQRRHSYPIALLKLSESQKLSSYCGAAKDCSACCRCFSLAPSLL